MNGNGTLTVANAGLVSLSAGSNVTLAQNTGSNGTLKLDGDDLAAIDLQDVRDDEILGLEYPPGPGRHAGRPPQGRAATVSAASPVVADPIAHVRVFEDFLGAVARRAAPCCDGPGGRRSVALIEAIYQSARTNLAVDLPPA